MREDWAGNSFPMKSTFHWNSNSTSHAATTRSTAAYSSASLWSLAWLDAPGQCDDVTRCCSKLRKQRSHQLLCGTMGTKTRENRNLVSLVGIVNSSARTQTSRVKLFSKSIWSRRFDKCYWSLIGVSTFDSFWYFRAKGSERIVGNEHKP